MIDILIPLYNVPKNLLVRCLSSICSQTISDQIQVTICDDGSPTSSIEIIDDFARYISIRYFYHETNQGVGLTRKFLYEHSDSEYVMWVDADDSFADCMVVERFLDRMESDEENQLVVGGYYRYHGDLKVEYVGFNITWLFAKMYKRAEIDRFGIVFNELKCNEDAFYNCLIVSCFKHIKFIDEPLYLWQDNADSVTRNKDKNELQQSLDFVQSSAETIMWIREHDFEYTDYIKCLPYDGLIQFYWEYCKMILDDADYCDIYMDSVFEYYKMVVVDIDEFANADLFQERYDIIPKQCIPTVTIWDWLWKLAERNGEFEK